MIDKELTQINRNVLKLNTMFSTENVKDIPIKFIILENKVITSQMIQFIIFQVIIYIITWLKNVYQLKKIKGIRRK